MRQARERKHSSSQAPTVPAKGLETRILSELSELKEKVDESLEQGRECNTDLKLLRKELGIDGLHGRLPVLEATVTKHEMRIGELETGKIEMRARHRLVHSILAFCGGSVGGTLITICGRIFGAH